MADAKGPTPGEITIMAGGAVALIFSFFDFYTIDVGTFSSSASAWSSGLFPVATLMVIFAVIMALQVALTKFAHVSLPARLLGFTWEQVHLILGFFAVVYAVAYLLQDRSGASLGIGFWGVLIGCGAAFVGAILLQKERGANRTGY
jgi:hypothetical protein